MNKIITLTAGHSDTDPGACAENHSEQAKQESIRKGLYEAAIVEDLRNRVADDLRSLGYQVRTDGTGSFNLPLGDALKLISGSEIAVELHLNGAVNPQANGVEVVALPRAKYRAQRLADAIANALGSRLRGDKGWIDQCQTHRGRLGFVGAGGLIVETFFITNPKELAAYLEAKDTVAYAIAQAIDDVVRIGEQEPA
jgi:N-acetylmuramoyl-L-alanine amidase